MKAMTKQQLARYAGVDVKTLRRWCEMHSEQLEKLGMRRYAKVLPPKVVKYLTEELCIEVE